MKRRSHSPSRSRCLPQRTARARRRSRGRRLARSAFVLPSRRSPRRAHRARPRRRLREEAARRHGHAAHAQRDRARTTLVLDTNGLDITTRDAAAGQRAGAVQARRRGSDPRQRARDPDQRRHADRGHRVRVEPRRTRAAVARAGDDRGEEASVPLHAVAGHPRAHLGAVSGHARRALHLRRDASACRRSCSR